VPGGHSGPRRSLSLDPADTWHLGPPAVFQDRAIARFPVWPTALVGGDGSRKQQIPRSRPDVHQGPLVWESLAVAGVPTSFKRGDGPGLPPGPGPPQPVGLCFFSLMSLLDHGGSQIMRLAGLIAYSPIPRTPSNRIFRASILNAQPALRVPTLICPTSFLGSQLPWDFRGVPRAL